MRGREFGRKLGAAALATVFVASAGATALARDSRDGKGEVRTMTVTLEADRGAVPAVAANDFAVYKDERRQQILEVRRASEAPVNLAVLIQDGLDFGVGHELGTIKEFIKGLPEGSKVMVGYLKGTNLQVVEDFTADREAAADSVRVPLSTVGLVGSAPFLNVIEALKRFDGMDGRNQVVVVTSGLELNRGFSSASPTQNIDLDRAIAEARRRGIPVWGIFANAAGSLGTNNAAILYGQSSLNRLSDETGGEAFFAGRGFVTFDHALDTVSENLDRQYLIRYRDADKGKIDVTVEAPGVKVRHAE